MLENAWLAWMILGSPLIAFVVVGLIGRRLPEGGAHVVVGSLAASLVIPLPHALEDRLIYHAVRPSIEMSETREVHR